MRFGVTWSKRGFKALTKGSLSNNDSDVNENGIKAIVGFTLEAKLLSMKRLIQVHLEP